MYFRGASVAVVVFDITNKASFESAKTWVAELRPTDASLIAMAGNKSDLGESRQVSEESARAWCDSEKIFYMETSAKSGSNVNEFFREIAKRLPRKSRSDTKDKGRV